MQLYVGSDNLIELRGLKDQQTSAYVNGATVTAKLLDSAGVTLLTRSLAYVTGTQGTYRGSISGFTLVQGETYTVEIVVITESATLTLRRKLSADYYPGRA